LGAEVVRCAIIVAVGSEFASLQAAHCGYLLLGKVRDREIIHSRDSAAIASPSSWYVGENGQWSMRSGRTKKDGSWMVGVGERERARMKLEGESGGVDDGDRVGELLSEDMLA